MKTYQWRKENGLAVLSGLFEYDVRYQEIALRKAIENVKERKSSYASENAYQSMLDMFEEGLICFA